MEIQYVVLSLQCLCVSVFKDIKATRISAGWRAESDTPRRCSSSFTLRPVLQREPSVWDAEVRRFQPVWDDAGCCGVILRSCECVRRVWNCSVTNNKTQQLCKAARRSWNPGIKWTYEPDGAHKGARNYCNLFIWTHICIASRAAHITFLQLMWTKWWHKSLCVWFRHRGRGYCEHGW